MCNKLERDPEDANTATNPAVVVEILSPSTEQYDRGEKLRHYQQISSLSHVVLVAHDEKRIDVWSRSEHGWSFASATSGERAALDDGSGKSAASRSGKSAAPGRKEQAG